MTLLVRMALVALALSMGPGAAMAQSPAWPTKPIRIVTPYAAGGPGDDSARMVADGLAKALGQPVIVDNKPGAGGIIGADVVAKAPADGYTLLAAANGTLINSLIRSKMPYAPGDLVPVTGVTASPSLLVVDPALAAKDLKALQALARAEPRGIFFATTGIGSTSHFSGELIKAALGVPLTFVQYKSGGESSAALHSGQVQMLSEVPSASLIALIGAGRMRALAVASDHRLAALPEVPTTVEAGFPDIRMTHWLGLMAPRGTPPAVMDRINAAVQKFISTPEQRKLIAQRNSEPMLGDRATFTRFIDDERRRLGGLAQQLRIVAE
ncbi:tripartite tricarboxylate transporter substrate binding protein [Pseudacidovorax sp. RU35E]|uniref:Bug family tripartite tricarboxylate transporter substrate binding protein n=1 Tax=Pseudacidovorax sp. RU35E TaxID=1907403 RepID=UPI0009539C41|nr:tripartite tricarboxylate transporter substrate binding protein [Pseudacidovorax sp. RU35E]SIR20179.1 Tripartite-type tricarboxylate transporter, receptor component TctC [Pseudacidovorax sp. RU35E]